MLVWIVIAVVAVLVGVAAAVDLRDRRNGHRIRTAREISTTVRLAKREARAQMRTSDRRSRKATQQHATDRRNSF